MRKSLLIAALVLGALSLSVRATTVSFSADLTSRSVVDASSNNVPIGSLVWIGVFSTPNAFTFNSGLSLATNVANIESAGGWQQFGLNPSTQSPEFSSYSLKVSSVLGLPKIGGSVEDDVTGSPTASADFFNGKTVYLWVFNGTSVANSTQMGIFQATSASPAWTFPNNGGGLSDGTTLGTDSGQTISAVGGAGSTTASTLQLAAASAVPEPSTWISLIGATGFLTMLRRRRSTQS